MDTPNPSPSDRLARQLLWYGTAAAGVAAVAAPTADAQIVYTDVDPDFVVQDTYTGDSSMAQPGYELDFDGDGDIEMFFAEQSGGNYSLAIIADRVTDDGPDKVTAIVGAPFPFGGNFYAYFQPLSAGASIGAFNATLGGYSQATFTFGGSDPLGWLQAGDAYLGVEFLLNDTDIHYGWVRVEVGPGVVTVKEFAYEATPGAPIEAGATGVAIEPGPDGTPGTHALTDAYPNPFTGRTQLALEVAEPQHVRVAVYNALGQQVALLHDGALAAGSAHALTLDGAGLASGVYVVRAVGEKFTAVRTLTLAR